MPVVKDHYEVLDIPISADASQIKKAHRKMALKWHPDKNQGADDGGLAAETFQYIQQAYECLSDPAERKWYDEHREAILRGWSAGDGDAGEQAADFLFDVVPYMHPGCFMGYGDDEEGFYCIYNLVFAEIYQQEADGWMNEGNIDGMPLHDLPINFGFSDSEWGPVVGHFYTMWESFSSCRAFAWSDKYDSKDADDRRMRRAMDEENRKARRAAKRQFNEDILALVHFVKRRDPRVKAQKTKIEEEKAAKRDHAKLEAQRKKLQAQEKREEWRMEAEERMAQEAADDLAAGRIRLADLDDDYDYGGGKKGKKGKKKKQKYFEEAVEELEELPTPPAEAAAAATTEESADGTEVPKSEEVVPPPVVGKQRKKQRWKSKQQYYQQEAVETPAVVQEEEEVGGTQTAVSNETLTETSGEAESDEEVSAATNAEAAADDEQVEEMQDEGFDEEEFYSSEEESSSEEEPEFWRCECCRKDFKSKGQMENHKKSKKHKEAFKKWQNKAKKEAVVMEDLLDELVIDDA